MNIVVHLKPTNIREARASLVLKKRGGRVTVTATGWIPPCSKSNISSPINSPGLDTSSAFQRSQEYDATKDKNNAIGYKQPHETTPFSLSKEVWSNNNLKRCANFNGGSGNN